MNAPDDRTLIAACIAGDQNAWVALVGRYERLIYSILLRHGLSESQAADVFQEVCLILLEKLDRLRDESCLAAWLMTVTRRECWKTLRRRDVAGAEDAMPLLMNQPANGSQPEDLVAQWEARQAVWDALARIGEPCRTLLQRLYYAQPAPSYAAIAAELGVPEGSIGPTRARCLKKLRHAMGGQHYRVRK
ncbi:MAG: sigma-70 family RNA polymerase sigma factor [Ardenticatenaceae bacterium]|nr:sigma-70 family RNA polymerase sigma factor [Ardenticatenaceae bacterium]